MSVQPCSMDGAVSTGSPAVGVPVCAPQGESLAGLVDIARQEEDALARLQNKVRELERHLEPRPRAPSPRPAPAPPSDGGSVEEGLSGSLDTSDPPQKETKYVREFLECNIQQTVWDCPAIIGLPAIGKGPSLALFGSLVLNLMLQMYICYILITSPRFSNPHPLKDQAMYAYRWRIQIAHEDSQLDASGSSLASRVCGGDKSLTVAAAHIDVLSDINAFLSLDDAGLRPQKRWGLGTGPLLCTVCIIVFVVMVMRELRVLATQLFALSSLPRGKTRIVNYEFVSLSRWRLIFVMVVSLVRAAVALILLYTGTVWLAATTSITDLILNCAALGFVLEVDERIHETVVPAWVHSFVAQLKPIPYRRIPKSLDGVVPLVSMVILVTLSISLLLIPNVSDMISVKRALCGGNLDFVIKQNDAGFVVARATVPYGPATDLTVVDARATLRSLAVSERITDRPLAENFTNVSQYSVHKFNREEFEADADLPIRDWADWALCEDMDKAYGGRWLRDMPAYFVAIRETTGLHKGLSLQEMPWNCSDYARAGFCANHSMTRLFCPISCGCTDPLSGLLFGQTSKGCPAQCMPLLQQASESRPCRDVSVGNEAWNNYWKEYAEFANRMVPQLRHTYDNYTAHKIAIGCNESTLDPIPGTLLCDERHPYMIRRGMRSIAAFCPKKCCGGQDPDHMCPLSCPRTNRPPPAWKKFLPRTR